MCQIMCWKMGYEEIDIVVYNSCGCQNWPHLWDPHRRLVQCGDRLAVCSCSDHHAPSLSSLHPVIPKSPRDTFLWPSFLLFTQFYLIAFWNRASSPDQEIFSTICLGLRMLPFLSFTIQWFPYESFCLFLEKSSFRPLVYSTNNFP